MNAKIEKKMEKVLQVSCVGCGACCSDMAVPITMGDLARLVEGSGLPANKIVRFLDKHEIDWEKDRDGWIKMSGGKRIMCLKKNKKRNVCKFLDEDKRCMVYEHRPLTCRTFPIDYMIDEKGAIVEFGTNEGIDCPHDKTGGNLKKDDFIKHMQQEEQEDDDFYAVINAWNKDYKGKRKKKKFLEFIGLL